MGRIVASCAGGAMNLTYILRLVCVVIVACGLSQAAAQFMVAMTARPILRYLETFSARQREHVLYLVQIGPALLAVFIAFALCLPAYIRSEPNRGVESVSIACLLITAGLGLWLGTAVLQGLRAALRTLRFTRACRRSGESFTEVSPLLVVRIPGLGVPAVLVGLLQPLVAVSDEFAAVADRLHPDAFGLALAHEGAHAAHCDNWKLLSLAFLPRCDQFLPRGVRWRDLWHTAADWAADDEAVDGNPARSLLLAETLVLAARCTHEPRPDALYAALASAEAGLSARVERLMCPERDPRREGSPILSCVFILAILAGAAIAVSPWIYTVSEWMLHLGHV
jgi:hypothetical protein